MIHIPPKPGNHMRGCVIMCIFVAIIWPAGTVNQKAWHDMTGITSGILWICIIRQECQVMVWRFMVNKAEVTCYMAFTLCHWDKIAILTKHCLHWLHGSCQSDTFCEASDNILSAVQHFRFCGTYQESLFRVLLYFVVIWCRGFYPYHSGLPHWHWGKS